MVCKAVASKAGLYMGGNFLFMVLDCAAAIGALKTVPLAVKEPNGVLQYRQLEPFYHR